MNPTERRRALTSLLAVPAGMVAVATVAGAASARDKGTDRLALLEAKQEITEVLYRYARGWDRLDEETLRSCFFADAQHQHGGFKGLSQDFITKAFPMVAKVKSTTHAISNVLIEVKGDKAVAECYFAAHHRRMNKDGTDEEDYFLSGRYLDRFEKRDGVWKIAARRGLNDLERVEARADRTFATAAPDSFGKRKPEDPLYALLAELNGG
ncbi:nuclear transport factor 2 family protein [Niveispirillum sp.]|uniref:nuclear transport factor 2 family protein n=1 Tax=Niveispirillum sp. TaxID=1917217 RepID=UPI001B6A24FA|nr:nuclear transport factor 2 family protein [Niveispirillum sp.]MBP7336278.1 nuclear transport factor 2 family protein [Niveispirillum sp.]